MIHDITPSHPEYNTYQEYRENQKVVLGYIPIYNENLSENLENVGRITAKSVDVANFFNEMQNLDNPINLNPSGVFKMPILNFKVENATVCLNGNWSLSLKYDFDDNLFYDLQINVPSGLSICQGTAAILANIPPVKLLSLVIPSLEEALEYNYQYNDLGDLDEILTMILNDPELNLAEHFEDQFGMVNIHMPLEAATAAKSWSYGFIQNQSIISDLMHYPLIYKVLHSNSDSNIGNGVGKEFYLNKLALLSCEGPWANPDDALDYNFGWASTNAFHRDPGEAKYGQPFNNNNLPIAGQQHRGGRGEFPGIDWMVYYNLYYNIWKEEIGIPYQKDIECNCVIDLITENINDIIYSSSGIPTFAGISKTINPFFPEYKEKGIESSTLLSRSLDIDLNAHISLNDDLLMCLPSNAVPYALTIKNGSELELLKDHSIEVCEGCQIVIEEGGHLNMSQNGSSILFKHGGELRMEAGSMLTMSNGNKIIMKGGTVNILDLSSLVMDNSSSIVVKESEVMLSSNSSLTLDNSSKFQCSDHSNFKVNNASILVSANAKLEFMNNANLYDLENPQYLCDNGGSIGLRESCTWFWGSDNHLDLNGNNSRIDLGGHVHLSENSVFSFDSSGSESGYVRILKEGNDGPRFSAEQNCKVMLSGNSDDDLILYIEEEANFWFDSDDLKINGFNLNSFKLNEIKLSHGNIQLEHEARFVANSNFTMLYCDVLGFGADRGFEILDQNYIAHNDFYNTKLKGNFTWANETLDVNHCDFENAKIEVEHQGYRISNCSFSNMGSGVAVFSEQLTLPSFITSSTFNSVENGVDETSKIELTIENCSFNDSQVAVRKEMGKSYLKCNSFEDNEVALLGEYSSLHLSALNRGGYNVFKNNEIEVELSTAHNLILDGGFNSFFFDQSDNPQELDIMGDLSIKQQAGIDLGFIANNNYWNSYDSENGFGFPGPDHGNSPYYNSINIHLDPVGQGNIPHLYLVDYYNVSNDCGTNDDGGTGVPGTIFTESSKYSMNAYGRTKFESPIFSDGIFEGCTLDSAIVFAMDRMELNNLEGDDEEAVDLFNEILTYTYESGEDDRKYLMDFAFHQMKITVGNLFLQKDIIPKENELEFHPTILKYVEVLNVCTADPITEENYVQQFLLELDKALLFQQIGNTWMSHQILLNLSLCGLKEREQHVLNKLITQIEKELVQKELGIKWALVENSTVDIDTSWCCLSTDADEFNFGSKIIGVNGVVFSNCMGKEMKSLANQRTEANIYPNPSNGRFKLEVRGFMEQHLKCKVFDVNGRIVFEDGFINKEEGYQFDIRGNEEGLYFFQLSNGDSLINTGKIVIQAQ